MGAKKDILTIIGGNIRKKRTIFGLSQSQLAFEADVTREFINKLESGKYNVSVKTLERIAIILEVDLKELLTPKISH